MGFTRCDLNIQIVKKAYDLVEQTMVLNSENKDE